MLKSMTGFGKAIVEFPEKTINIEVRSVNSKNFDFMTRIPPQFREKEPEMRKLAQTILSRGKIELSLTETQGNAGSSVEINPVAMKKHYAAMKAISADLGLESKADILSAILRIPDVLVTAQHQLNPEEWEMIKKGITQAFEAMDHFRQVEGAALKLDFEKRIQHISDFSARVTPFEEGRIQQLRNRFEKDLTNVIDQNRIDRNRLEQEIIYYLEKLDITEEKVRLSQHLEYFTTTLNEKVSQGKKLNFISQEIGRELNTLGSKANHAQIQQLVVNMKDELEKIKEQMLNIL